MKPLIAVIGGTGKSGKYVVKQLLHEGYRIKLLLRQPENLQIDNPLLQPVKGDARNQEAILALLQGCDAVISTLGQPKGETPIFSAATTNVLYAMQAHGISRYIVTTGVNVDTSFDAKGTAAKFATEWMKTNYTATTADKQTEYEILSASGVDWTLVRLPLIEQTDTRNEVNLSLKDCPGSKISAADLAHFLISQLNDGTYYKKAPFIANK